MVNIDNVYQKVLILANKEQRGYITPQEFNLLADKAQMEIFENYFFDLKNAHLKPKNHSNYSDEMEILSEKLQFFRVEDEGATFTLPTGTSQLNLGLLVPTIYRLDTISIQYTNTDGSVTVPTEILEVDRKEVLYIESNPLTMATSNRPTYVRGGGNILRMHPETTLPSSLTVYYWRRPTQPRWAYVVVSQKALYNMNTSNHFELHPSEEENLVIRILALAGISIKNMEVAQAATVDEANTLKKQND